MGKRKTKTLLKTSKYKNVRRQRSIEDSAMTSVVCLSQHLAPVCGFCFLLFRFNPRTSLRTEQKAPGRAAQPGLSCNRIEPPGNIDTWWPPIRHQRAQTSRNAYLPNSVESTLTGNGLALALSSAAGSLCDRLSLLPQRK